MKIALRKDMDYVRWSAKLRIGEILASRYEITIQKLAYMRKEEKARSFLLGETENLSQLKNEASRRGISTIELAEKIVAKAEADNREQEKIEAMRVDFCLRLDEAATENEAKAIVDEFRDALAK